VFYPLTYPTKPIPIDPEPERDITIEPPNPNPSKTHRRSLRRFGCAAVVMLMVTMLLAAVGIGRGLWQDEPKYWKWNQYFLEQTPQVELADMADRAFNRVLGELSQSRGYRPATQMESDPPAEEVPRVRTIRLNFDQVNAWLDQRFAGWMENQQRQLPRGVSSPMLSSHAGRLVVAFRYESEEITQVFSVFLSLTPLDDGQATLQIQGVRGGRLPIPVGMALDQLPAADDESGEDPSGLLGVVLGGHPFDPILPIDGTRHARIIGLSVDETTMSLTVRAEANGKDD